MIRVGRTNLLKLLDERLLARYARLSTLIKGSRALPIREELHSHCFDEIIRQITIDSPERGFTLFRNTSHDNQILAQNDYRCMLNSIPKFTYFWNEENNQKQIGKKWLRNYNCRFFQKLSFIFHRKYLKFLLKNKLLNKKDSVEKMIQEIRAIDESKNKREIEFHKY